MKHIAAGAQTERRGGAVV